MKTTEEGADWSEDEGGVKGDARVPRGGFGDYEELGGGLGVEKA